MNNFFSMYNEIIVNSTNSVPNFFLLITINLSFFIIISEAFSLFLFIIKEKGIKKGEKNESKRDE